MVAVSPNPEPSREPGRAVDSVSRWLHRNYLQLLPKDFQYLVPTPDHEPYMPFSPVRAGMVCNPKTLVQDIAIILSEERSRVDRVRVCGLLYGALESLGAIFDECASEAETVALRRSLISLRILATNRKDPESDLSLRFAQIVHLFDIERQLPEMGLSAECREYWQEVLHLHQVGIQNSIMHDHSHGYLKSAQPLSEVIAGIEHLPLFNRGYGEVIARFILRPDEERVELSTQLVNDVSSHSTGRLKRGGDEVDLEVEVLKQGELLRQRAHFQDFFSPAVDHPAWSSAREVFHEIATHAEVLELGVAASIPCMPQESLIQKLITPLLREGYTQIVWCRWGLVSVLLDWCIRSGDIRTSGEIVCGLNEYFEASRSEAARGLRDYLDLPTGDPSDEVRRCLQDLEDLFVQKELFRVRMIFEGIRTGANRTGVDPEILRNNRTIIVGLDHRSVLGESFDSSSLRLRTVLVRSARDFELDHFSIRFELPRAVGLLGKAHGFGDGEFIGVMPEVVDEALLQMGREFPNLLPLQNIDSLYGRFGSHGELSRRIALLLFVKDNGGDDDRGRDRAHTPEPSGSLVYG